MALTTAQIQQAYVTFFSRPADPVGLAYWQNYNGSVANLYATFAQQTEYSAAFSDLTPAQQVNVVYQNLFGRDAETSGLVYWAEKVAAGQISIANLALAVSAGSQGTDSVTVASRVSAATAFTTAADTGAEILGYSGAAANAAAKTWLAGVKTSADLAAAVTVIDTAVATVAAAGGVATSVGGVALTTATTDTFNGTAANDAFRAVFSATAAKQTYDSGDAVIDSSTTDADAFTLTTDNDNAASASIRNIETINVNADTVSTAAATGTILNFAATNISGAKTYNFDVTKDVTAISGLTVTGLVESVAVNASADFKAIDLTATAGKSLTIAAAAVGTSGTPVTVTTSTGSGGVTVTGAGHLSVAPTSTGMVNATAEKSLTFTAAAATSTVLIGNAKDGNLTVADGAAGVVMDLKASGDISITKTGAGSVKAVAGGTITVAGAADADLTTGEFSSVGESAIDGNDLSAVVLSGNGAAATYTMATGNHAALADVTVRGANDVKLIVEASEIAGALNVYDETTAGTVTVELGSTTGAVNTSSNKIDVLKVTADHGTDVITVASGQEVTFKVDQTLPLIAVGTAANAATQSVTVKLDDGTRNTAAVDLTAITITQAKTVTIDASIDTTAAGAANASSVGGITASGANSNVTINTGINGLTLTGTNTVGTGTLTVTGSGPIALGTSTLTASAFDASAVTGAVTGTTFNPTNVRTISTGTKGDTLTLANVAAADLTINTNAGNDALTIASLTTADKITSIDMGEGEDTLKFQASTTLYKGTTGSVALAGVETIQFNTTTTTDQGIQASLLNGATYAVKASAAGGTNAITVKVASTDTAVDLSKLVGSSATESTIAAMSFVTDASSNTSGIAISGLTNAINTITGSASSDTLTGGTKADTFVYSADSLLFSSAGAMLDTVAGGTGTDSYVLSSTAAAIEIANTDSWANSTSVEKIVSNAANTQAITIALDATAMDAGITTVDLRADTVAGGAVVNAAEYTSSISITGSGGTDTLTGGSGDDTFFATTTTLLMADTIVGGAGTDILSFGVTGTAVTLADTVSFATKSGVETLKAVANTAVTNTIALHANAWTAGIRTVDMSLITGATGNTIDISEIVGGGMNLIGSATGATTFTGGTGADTITGGSAVDTLLIGAGSDQVNFASTATLNGADVLTVVGDTLSALKFNFSAFLGSSYAILGDDGVGTDITEVDVAATGDVNVAGKLAVLQLAAGDSADVDTAAELFALIDGTGDAFALSSGKAVIAVWSEETTTSADDAEVRFFYLDTTTDGASGLSVSDITLVGTAAAIDDDDAASFALLTTNFM